MAADINTQLQNISTDVTAIGNLVNRLTTIFSAGGVQNPDLAVMQATLQADYTNKINSTVKLTGDQSVDGIKTFTDGLYTHTSAVMFLPSLATAAPSSVMGHRLLFEDKTFAIHGELSTYCDTSNTISLQLGTRPRGSAGTFKGFSMTTTTSGDSNVNLNSVLNLFHVYPTSDNVYNVGNANFRWKGIYAGNGTIITSDERLKTDIQDIPEVVLRAWGKCNFKQYRFKDAIAEKGDAARIHFGGIAQQFKRALEEEGIDPTRYGFFCFDKWDAQYRSEVKEVRAEVRDSLGNVVTPAEYVTENVLVSDAGERYSLRYEELLVLEAAYQRYVLNSIKSKLGIE